MEKMTKKDYFNAIREFVANKPELVEFVDAQLAQLETRAVKAKEYKAKKAAEGDALKDLVLTLLTNEYQVANDLVAQIDNEEVTKAKVIARLTKLVNEGLAVKTDVKTEKATAKAYKLAD